MKEETATRCTRSERKRRQDKREDAQIAKKAGRRTAKQKLKMAARDT